MSIVILHYHLNRGGVTQVVLNHLRGLNLVAKQTGERPSVLIIYGGRRDGVADRHLEELDALNLSLDVLPALDYDEGTNSDGTALAGEIQQIVQRRGFAPSETLLHVHNHSIGKNVSLPSAMSLLAGQGFRVLLQIHDFAEDLRPENYRRLSDAVAVGGDPSGILYPQASQIHYAVLNGRDYRILRGANVYESRLHLLANTVGDFENLPPKEEAREKVRQRFGIDRDTRIVLYPVRGIRRKNVGELLLWAAAAPEKTVFGITLPPADSAENASYRDWHKLSDQLQLPCVFDMGGEEGLPITANLTAADLLLTTSVAEGFGLVFLEAWLAGRGLVGRDLPEITADFRKAGMELEQLHPELLVPMEWIGREELHSELSAHFGELFREYGLDSVPQEEVERRVASLIGGEFIDFAMLDHRSQTHTIERVKRDASSRDQLIAANPFLHDSLTRSPAASTIEHNARVVRTTYSLEAGGIRLRELYRSILESPIEAEVKPLADGDSILNAFLDIQRLHPVRWER